MASAPATWLFEKAGFFNVGSVFVASRCLAISAAQRMRMLLFP